MKKSLISFFLCILSLALLLTGCKNGLNLLPSKEAPGLQAPLHHDVSIQFGDFQGRASLSAESYETFSLSFSEPQSMVGFSVKLENSVYRHEMNGLATEHKQDTMPSQDVASLLFLPLRSVMKKEYTAASYKDGVWTYEGIVANSIYFVTQNHETGELISLRIPQKQFEANFLPPTA
ncbi:MAG: hypothetical protein LBS36_02915 [Oscillospiraceae bacterium]|nr:hypothetical protein [Oscillospiraceae bacterium]